MSWRPHPKRTTLNVRRPDPWTTCDRSGFISDHSTMRFQVQWSGQSLVRTGAFVAADQYDTPSKFLRTIVLPPDPNPLFNARPEPYTIDETDWRITQDGSIRSATDGGLRVTEPSATEAETENT